MCSGEASSAFLGGSACLFRLRLSSCTLGLSQPSCSDDWNLSLSLSTSRYFFGSGGGEGTVVVEGERAE